MSLAAEVFFSFSDYLFEGSCVNVTLNNLLWVLTIPVVSDWSSNFTGILWVALFWTCFIASYKACIDNGTPGRPKHERAGILTGC